MLIRPYRVTDVRDYFISAKNHDYATTTDKTGVKCLELIGASFEADEPAIFGTPNIEYIKKEIDWYQSMSLNINDIYDEFGKAPPAAWQYAANADGMIHSNYGYLIYHKDNGYQYDNVVQELKDNPESRRAVMIYQRPEIWNEYDLLGCNDFICTNSVAYYIRDGKLNCSVSMRSNDVVYGYKNDYAWQQFVLYELADELGVEPGKMIWQVQNLHVYEKHFGLVKPSETAHGVNLNYKSEWK
jgi:thymidylate synthase|tara:strand:- start:2069 stop:2794 length:726 start_codon:yes stop_codon:yes gene_type:complete